MQHFLSKKSLVKSCLFIAVCLTAFMSSAKAGLDFYEIYIGKKLVVKRYLDKPLSLENLPLSQANVNEQLVIHYYQCNAPDKLGSKRSITFKDGNGNNIKEWKFADAKGSKTGMAIPIKELLQLQKTSKGSALSLVYSAEGLKQGQKLAFLAAGSKTVGFIKKDNKNNVTKVASITGRIPLRINCL